MPGRESCILFTAAMATGVLWTWGVRAFAIAQGIVNHPNPLVPQHRKPVAYLGGLGVFLGAGSVVLWALMAGRWGIWRGVQAPMAMPCITVAATLYLALGIVDDLRVLSAGMKFVGQASIAALAVGMGIARPLTGNQLADYALCWFWIVTLVNAFNLIDVCDGLVGGLSTIVFVCIAWLFPQQAPLASILAGACMGFMVFNAPPATIFLGDAGSHLLGFLVAALLVLSPVEQHNWPWASQAILIAGVPLFELAFLIVVRTRKGLCFWKGSPDHFALRLQATGLTRWQTDWVAWGAAAAMCAAAMSQGFLSPAVGMAVLAGIAAGLSLCWRLLLRWEVRPSATRTMEPTVTESAEA